MTKLHRSSLKLCLLSVLLSTSLRAGWADIAFDFDSLEHALQQQEARFSDIVAGSEKSIRWHNGSKSKTKLALVYIHGFSASRQELSPTTELLADQLGANVFYARLQGHGRSEDAMAEASVDGWKRDARQALAIGHKIGEKVVVVSTSTGGTLATWLIAQSDSDKVLANILVSPNYAVASTLANMVTWPGGLTLARWLGGDYREFTPQNELHQRFWTNRYPIEAVLPMFELLEEVGDLDKSKIHVPQLIVYSPNDKVIDVEAIDRVSTEFTAAQVQTHLFLNSTDPYQHVLAGDACSPESTQEMVALMQDFIAEQANK